jgi:hypothetical protein
MCTEKGEKIQIYVMRSSLMGDMGAFLICGISDTTANLNENLGVILMNKNV